MAVDPQLPLKSAMTSADDAADAVPAALIGRFLAKTGLDPET